VPILVRQDRVQFRDRRKAFTRLGVHPGGASDCSALPSVRLLVAAVIAGDLIRELLVEVRGANRARQTPP
jgi:hypothetical protein